MAGFGGISGRNFLGGGASYGRPAMGGIARTSYSSSQPNATPQQMQQIQQMNSRPVPNRPADYHTWSQRDRDRWDRRTAAGDPDPFAGWRRDPVSGGGGGAPPPGGGGGAGGPSTGVPVPEVDDKSKGGGISVAKASDSGGYSVGGGQAVNLRQGLGNRTPPSLAALLQGLRY